MKKVVLGVVVAGLLIVLGVGGFLALEFYEKMPKPIYGPFKEIPRTPENAEFYYHSDKSFEYYTKARAALLEDNNFSLAVKYKKLELIEGKWLGNNTSQMYEMLWSLAGPQWMMGDYAGSETSYRDACNLAEKLSDLSKNEVQNCKVWLASVLVDQKKYDEAKKLLKKTKRELKGLTKLGARIDLLLGKIHLEEGDVSRAEREIGFSEGFLYLAKKDPVENYFRHPLITYNQAESYYLDLNHQYMAEVSEKKKNYKKAEKLYQDVLRSYREFLPVDHPKLKNVEARLKNLEENLP